MKPLLIAIALAVTLATSGCGGDDGSKKATPKPRAGHFIEAAFSQPVPDSVGQGTPVRVAGVNVGAVTNVERGGAETIVEFEITEMRAWPQHQDARVKIRPRIFKEGQYFLDVIPGSPAVKPLLSGGRIPSRQTSAQTGLPLPPELPVPPP